MYVYLSLLMYCVCVHVGVYCEQAAGIGKALQDLKQERCAAQPCVHATGCLDLQVSCVHV